MSSAADRNRDRSHDRSEFPAEELYLMLRNLELSVDQFLLENGVVMDARTRAFLAQARDATGAIADRVRSQIDERSLKS